MTGPEAAGQQLGLRRVMGPGLLLLFIVGDILGTGVYALIGDVAAEVGGAAWVPFLVAFVVMCAGITSASTAARFFAANFFIGFNFSWGTAGIVIVAALFIVVLAAVNLRGVGESVKLNVGLTITELAGLLLVIAVGLFAFAHGGNADFSRVVAFNTPANKNVFLAVTVATSLACFAMTGFEDSVNMAEETKDPVSHRYPIG